VIPTNPDLFTRITYDAFQVTLLIVFLAWPLKHLLHVLTDLSVEIRKFWIAIRRQHPKPPEIRTSPSNPLV
jgi:hypothetical protein